MGREPAPLHATAWDPTAPSTGKAAWNVATTFGITLDPWQRYVLNTAGELVEDEGEQVFRYPTVVLYVPRRAGKTTVALSSSLASILGGRGRRGWYTSHRLAVAQALFRDEWVPMLQGSRLRRLVKVRLSNGSESFTVPALGSVFRLFQPDGEALRSQNADQVTVDEARMFTLEQGTRLEAAVSPAQARRARRQLWVVSNQGRAGAAWARKWRDLGRAGTPGVAFFEWAAPADADPDDPDTLDMAHPALAHHPRIRRAIEADRLTMDPADWRAEYLGWWEDPAVALAVLDPRAWAACADTAAAVGEGAWWVCADVASDRSRAAVAVASNQGGTVVVELLATGRGATWVGAMLADLVTSRRGARVVVDGYGPGANLALELAAAVGADVVEVLGTTDVVRRCATFHDLVTAGKLRHRAQPELDAALGESLSRRIGDGWVWDRRATPPATVAVTLAAAQAAPVETGRPVVAYGAR